jgi:branched-chain amino acid aminotransferase
MPHSISINKAADSKAKQIDINQVPMGIHFTDHMFVCDFSDGKWQNARIEPLSPIPTHPSAMALHYGQAIFEGLKATMGKDETPVLFRPEENARRLNESARRMGMPDFPEELFVDALKQLVWMERAWVPTAEGSALYLRPFMYADEAFTGMRAATHYKFIIFATPAGPYFSKRIRLFAETQYIRAAAGGTGEAKAAGNYAAAIKPTELAKKNGYDQVLWLDAKNFENILEVGTMNIFFKIEGKFITPKLDGTVLAGVTRSSVIHLLRHWNFEVEERSVSIREIAEAQKNGTLEEGFGTGTAVGIALIDEITWDGNTIKFPIENPIGNRINDFLNALKTEHVKDDFGWVCSTHPSVEA